MGVMISSIYTYKIHSTEVGKHTSKIGASKMRKMIKYMYLAFQLNIIEVVILIKKQNFVFILSYTL